MAKVENFNLKDQVGKLGGAVYYVVNGETRSRKLAASVSNPRTNAQMLQRVRWANLVNFYRANRSWMKYAFETKKANQSEYNKFMSLNVSSSPIYLTKQQAAGGACVAYPYIITQGSLGSIEHTISGNYINTNLYLGGSFDLLPSTTVAELSIALVENNPALQYGDQISLIRVYQSSNVNTGYPYIIVRKYEMILSQTNVSSWANYLPSDIVQQAGPGSMQYLAIATSERVGGVSFILSRTVGGKTYVSTQSLVVVGNSSLINTFSSQNQLQAAIDSYGASEEVFLSSTTANQASSEPFANSVLSLQLGDLTFLPGSRAMKASDYEGKTLKINFAEAPGSTFDALTILTNEDVAFTGLTKSVSGTQVTITGFTPPSGHEDDYVTYIEMTFDDDRYIVRFPVIISNADTIGGLE